MWRKEHALSAEKKKMFQEVGFARKGILSVTVVFMLPMFPGQHQEHLSALYVEPS